MLAFTRQKLEMACIMNVYPALCADEMYELVFWGRIDFYSGKATQCRIELCESNDSADQMSFDISPICPNAVARKGDWVLYKYPFKARRNGELVAKIIAFEANIAVMQALPEDELVPGVVPINHKEDVKPFITFNELPLKEYDFLEQRVVKYYQELLAPYHPVSGIPEDSQRDYLAFVEAIYDKLCTNPGSFFTKLFEDDAIPNRFNNGEYGKPELKRHIKDDQKKIEGLFAIFAEIVKAGELTDGGLAITSKLTKKQLSQLTYMGLEMENGILKSRDYPNLFAAAKLLAQKDGSLWPLMFCWFDDAISCLERTYAKLYDKVQYDKLTGWLRENGYCAGSHSGLSLDYYKKADDKERPLGFALLGDKFHYGFTFSINAETRVRQFCLIRILQFGQMLHHFDGLSEGTKKLILSRARRCDGCRYCVQTDKTGTRPRAAITISTGDTICPYFPSYTFSFEYLNRDVDAIIDFLIDMEAIIKAGKKK